MRLLLDTNILIMLIERGRPRLTPTQRAALLNTANTFSVSAVSLWEMALKQRKGKLDVGDALIDIENRLQRARISILPLTARHATGDANLPVEHKDPFDRIIAFVAETENLRLMTTDTKLRDHPLAWRP